MIKRIKSKKGISLIFVLAAMLTLLALGVSAFAAAALSAGAGAARRDRIALQLYADSMERTVWAALGRDGAAGPLGDRLIERAFDAIRAELGRGAAVGGFHAPFIVEVPIYLAAGTHDIAVPVDNAEFAIEISGRLEAVAAPTPDAPGLPHISAEISGEIRAAITTIYHGQGREPLQIQSRTTFHLRGAGPGWEVKWREAI